MPCDQVCVKYPIPRAPPITASHTSAFSCCGVMVKPPQYVDRIGPVSIHWNVGVEPASLLNARWASYTAVRSDWQAFRG